MASGLPWGEVVEDRVHDAGLDVAAQRGCAPGEIGIPVVTQTERHQLLGRLVSRIGDEPDRLHKLEHAAGSRARYERCHDRDLSSECVSLVYTTNHLTAIRHSAS